MNCITQLTCTRATVSLSRFATAVILAALMVSSACSDQDVTWTETEKENIQYFFSSGDANRAAVAYSNNADEPFLESEYLIMQRRALADAKKVTNEVLAKAHQELPDSFRNLYQKSLELSIEAFENKDNVASAKSSTLHDQWVDWYKDHRREIRIPR